ncbi:hypothetical protein [Sphingomonas xanthus]|nr:hypothetical protein [Sphingomonas xanthus]
MHAMPAAANQGKWGRTGLSKDNRGYLLDFLKESWMPDEDSNLD